MPSQEGVLCLPAESQVYGADTRICDTTQGELNRTKGEHQHSRRTYICSFLQDRTEAAEAVAHCFVCTLYQIYHSVWQENLL